MVIIDKDACIGCGACVGGCPVGALSLSDEGYSVCDGDTCIGDYIPNNEKGPEDIAMKNSLTIAIKQVLKATLKEKEINILVDRFGLDDHPILTLEEVGRKYNVTRERIRQIESKALHKLRRPKARMALIDFLKY